MFLLIDSNIKKLNEIMKTINNYSSYLQTGTYEYSLTSKSFAFIRNKKNLSFLSKTIGKKYLFEINESKLPELIVNEVNKITIEETPSNSCLGNILMITARNNVKIFNTETKRVFVFTKNKADFSIFRKSHEYFSKYYKTPIISFNDKAQYHVEKLIEYKPLILWSLEDKEQAIYTINNNILKQLNDLNTNESKSITVNEMLDSLLSNFDNVNLIFKKINSLIPMEKHKDSWPILPCHGDIHFNNMLLDDTNGDTAFYFIDWEDHQPLIFFHDFFNCIFVEAVWNNNTYFLIRYMDGHYDYLLNNLFNSASLNYDKQERQYYFSLYLISRLLNFEFKFNKGSLKSISKKYIELISLIE